MKADGRLTLTLVRELLRRGSIQRIKRRLEDRLMGAILDATRVTNDGSYRRYRDDPTARGELVRDPSVEGAGDAAIVTSVGAAPPEVVELAAETEAPTDREAGGSSAVSPARPGKPGSDTGG